MPPRDTLPTRRNAEPPPRPRVDPDRGRLAREAAMRLAFATLTLTASRRGNHVRASASPVKIVVAIWHMVGNCCRSPHGHVT